VRRLGRDGRWFYLSHIHDIAWQIAWGLSGWAPYLDPELMLAVFLAGGFLAMAAGKAGLFSRHLSPRRSFWTGSVFGVAINFVVGALLTQRIRE